MAVTSHFFHRIRYISGPIASKWLKMVEDRPILSTTWWRYSKRLLRTSLSFFFPSFFPKHGAQQPLRGRPSDLYHRFVHRCSYYHWPTDLSYPSRNIYMGSKSAIFGLIADQRSTLMCCGLETEQDIFTILNCVCSDDLTMSPPSLVQIGPRVFKTTPVSIWAPLKRTKNLSLIVNNSAAIDRSCSNLECGLTTWRAICHTCSRSRGETSRS